MKVLRLLLAFLLGIYGVAWVAFVFWQGSSIGGLQYLAHVGLAGAVTYELSLAAALLVTCIALANSHRPALISGSLAVTILCALPFVRRVLPPGIADNLPAFVIFMQWPSILGICLAVFAILFALTSADKPIS